MKRNNIIVGQGYTIPVCSIVEQIWMDGHPDEEFDQLEPPTWKEGLQRIDEQIAYARPEIFYFDYPYYGDESDKEHLEKHIIESYYTRDICCDSMMRWIMYLKERMQDIMPKYKAFYDAQIQLMASDILDPYHLKETKDLVSNKSTIKTNESVTSGSSKSDSVSDSSSISNTDGVDNTVSKDVNKQSNTPQAMASAVDSGDEIPLSYLSAMNTNKNTSENDYNSSSSSSDNSKTLSKREDDSSYQSSDTGSENKVDKIIRDIKGNLSKMNNAQLVKDYQDVILNIEKMITDELADLFYLMY